MTDDPYTIIHTGDPYDFVIKNVNEPETYGTFHGDKYDQKSMKKFIEKVNSIVKENKQLKQDLEEYCNFSLHDVLDKKNKEIEQLKQQCKDFMEMLDDMCIAYLVNDGLEEILND